MKKFSVVTNMRKAKSLLLKGKIDNATQLYNEILEKFPNNVNARTALGILINNEVDKLVNLYNSKKFAEVISRGKPLISEMNKNEYFWNILGAAYIAQSLHLEALKTFQNVIRCNPKSANGYNNLGCVHKDLRDLHNAKKCFEAAVMLDPKHSDAYFNLGLTHHVDWELEDAIKNYQNSININPLSSSAQYHLGHAFNYLGKKNDAIVTFNKVLELEPEHCDAIRGLSELINFDKDHMLMAHTEKLLRSKNIALSSNAALHFAYAKMNDDVKNYSVAVEYFKKGGQIRKKSIGYDINKDVELFYQIKLRSAKIALNKSVDIKFDNSMQPIFILGMPRSGTSLVEQIVSAHSEVIGCGELVKLNDLTELIQSDSIIDFEGTLREIRSEYLKYVTNKIGKTRFFTDKMPSNFRHIDIIFAAFPEAKIIHCVRDASAVCWSNFRTFYSEGAIPFSYDLGDLVDYHRLYSDLMSFWKNKFGEKIYDLNYEALVADPDNEIKKMISYTELPWDEKCLAPHKNQRIVGTASSIQVKKKIYKGSSETWKNYKSYLSGALDLIAQKD